MKVLFILTGLFTLVFSYQYLSWMLLEESNKTMFSSYLNAALRRSFKMDFQLNETKFYLVVALGELFMLMKWFGSFMMLRSKSWGFILFVIPNLILLFVMVLLVSLTSWNLNNVGITAVTIAMVMAYVLALIQMRKKRKSIVGFRNL